MQVMVSFSIHPGSAHTGDDIARAVKIIRESGLDHEVGPSGTTIVGEWDDVFSCLKRCHEAVDDERVHSVIKVDKRRGGLGPDAIRKNVEKVERRLEAA